MGNICKGDKCLFPQVDDVEIAIPLEQLPAAMKDIKQITDATKVCFPVFGIYVRFGLASKNTLLGPARNGDVAYVELHVLRTRNGSPHLGFAAIDEIRQLLLLKYNGMLLIVLISKSFNISYNISPLFQSHTGQAHYGKNFAVDFIGSARLASNSVRESQFTQITARYDPKGLFQNDFLQSRKKSVDEMVIC